MDENTAASTPASASTSARKIPAPASKPHQTGAETVYELLQITHTRRVEINNGESPR